MLYVVDTSVFLSDPHSLERLSDKDIVIPLTVITELEAKRSHLELGYAARNVLRSLESYRVTRGLTEPVKTPEGGSIRIEMNHIDDSVLPTQFQGTENDVRILAVAANLSKEGTEVTLLSKDLPLRLRASIVGLHAEDWTFENENGPKIGVHFVDVYPEDIDYLYDHGSISAIPFDFPENTGLILRSGSSSALGRIVRDRVQLVKDKSLFEVRGRSAEQRIAIDILRDPDVGIVSLGGSAGTGKTMLAVAAGLEAVLEQSLFKKVTIFRSLYPVGGQDLGFLPGSADEKMAPWTAAIHDALDSICRSEVVDHVIENNLLEVLPLTHIRGRTLTDTFIIVDEAQNLDKTVLLTALTRVGDNSRIVLTHDVDQRDNMRVGKYDGISAVVNRLAGNSLFGHVTLTKSERSPVAKLAAELLS